MILPRFMRIIACVCALALLLNGFGEGNMASAFQIKGGKNLRIMQSGNPGTSGSYTVFSNMRVQQENALISQTILAPLPTTTSSGGGGSAKKNHIIDVCDPDTGKCVAMFPTGDDGLYTAYENCLKTSSQNPRECATDWAMAKGLLPEPQYLAQKEAEKVAAQEREKQAKEKLTFDLEDGLKAQIVDDKDEPLRASAPEESAAKQIFDLGVDVSDLQEVSEPVTPGSSRVSVPLEQPVSASNYGNLVVDDLKSAASERPEVILVPREPDSTVEREFFSCVQVPGYVVYNDLWKWLAYRLFLVFVLMVIIIFLLAFWVFLLWKRSNKEDEGQKKPTKKLMKSWKKWLGVLALVILPAFSTGMAQTTTTPQLLIYEGQLLDNASAPLSGPYTFRFSFWANADFENTDIVAGAINGAAIDYYGWQEIQSQTLDAAGNFSFQIGNVTPFVAGMFDQDNLYLQVEVKASTDPDTAYETIDVDSTNAVVDRKVIAAVPFAFNANKLDFRDSGFGPGDIPFLDGAGQLPASAIPGGTNENNFTLDDDGSAALTDSLTLQFGDTIAESLTWSGLLGRFELSDDLQVQGDLIVTGSINGVVLGPQNVSSTLAPRYPNSIFEKDGSNNSGSMYEEREAGVSGVMKQVLRWTSEEPVTQQDYDVLIRYTLPQSFTSWQTPALELEYIGPGTVGDAHIDFRAYRDGTTTDQLSGTGLDLSSATWQNQTFNLSPTYTWMPGDTLWLELKMHSRAGFDARIADIRLNYVSE